MSKIVFKTEQQIKDIVKNAIKSAYDNGELCSDEAPDFIVEVPADRSHGDYATNAAMVSAKVWP